MNIYHSSNYLFKQLANERIVQVSNRGSVPKPISEGGGERDRHGVKGWIVMKNEMSRRQFLGFAGSAAAVLGLGLVGCGGSAGSGSSASGDAAEVYFLNFKPEVDKEWKEIAKAYKEEKGIEVKIVTAASNTYEEKLKSEMSKSSAPTLFQVNGPTGLKNWKDYCADLSDTKVRGELIDDSLALQSDGKDLGIDWVQESYGIIYNKQLLEKAGYKAEDIDSFDKLKACADDIQARKDELGVDGAFTSAGMDDSSSWRYTTHLANLPLYYEFEKEHNQEDDEIKGEFLDNYKQIFDLYITDSTCDPSQLASKTGDDATNEFATGKAVFYQNGSWAYADLTKAGMTDDQIGMMPIYIGVDGEENQGLCSGGENYWCVSSQASEDAQKATEDFMYWCVTADTPTSIIADKMGLTAPFKSAKDTTNIFSQQAVAMAKDGKKTVAWDFVYIPSEEWKKNLKQALIAYAADNSKWDGVKNAFVDGWKTEKAASE